jgi:DNA-directed RNA polymerase subunit RPC12/RpoP
MAEQCPNCKARFAVRDDEMAIILAHIGDDEETIEVEAHICPECGQRIIYAEGRRVHPGDQERIDFSGYVPPALLRDYEEAQKVIDASPKASAMLGRRCLQGLLREQFGVERKSLDQEIDYVLRSNLLPSYLGDDLDAIRLIGNFAAHPMKSERTGEILDVEPGEAHWTIKVLEGLFDFCFVAPFRAQLRRHELNEKLKEAGKPAMKAAPVIVLPHREAKA